MNAFFALDADALLPSHDPDSVSHYHGSIITTAALPTVCLITITLTAWGRVDKR
jgi:hypothetical protein